MSRGVQWLLLLNLLALIGWGGIIVKVKMDNRRAAATSPTATAGVAGTQPIGAPTVPLLPTAGPGTGGGTPNGTAAPPAPTVVNGTPSGVAPTAAPSPSGTPEPVPAVTMDAASFVTIDSEPPGARVMERGQTLGRTPYVIPRPAQGATTVVVAKTGYRSSAVSISSHTPERVTVRLEEEAYPEEDTGAPRMPSLPPPP